MVHEIRSPGSWVMRPPFRRLTRHVAGRAGGRLRSSRDPSTHSSASRFRSLAEIAVGDAVLRLLDRSPSAGGPARGGTCRSSPAGVPAAVRSRGGCGRPSRSRASRRGSGARCRYWARCPSGTSVYPFSSRTIRSTASRLVGWPFSSGARSSTVICPPSVREEGDLGSVALLAAGESAGEAVHHARHPSMPGVGECGLNGVREPSTVSARKLSSEARMLPPLAWWLAPNSSASRRWQPPQSRGVTTVAT